MMCEQARFVYLISTSYTANCIKFPLILGISQSFCSCVNRNEVSLCLCINICVYENLQ